MHNLGITHILNVSGSIPNTFEESKTMKMTYHRINIEDNKDVPIQLSFNLAYDFIESAISPKKVAKTRLYQVKFDLLQNFVDTRKQSLALVSSAAKTHNIILDLCSWTTENRKDPEKDKMYSIDNLTQLVTQNSKNQNRVLVH